ncbi:MAG: AAA family ATPase, partial [Ktedonobacteraceae bacterium]
KNGTPHECEKWPDPPPWRIFASEIPEILEKDDEQNNDEYDDSEEVKRDQERGRKFKARDKEVDMINAALLLRRPLLVTGKPGSGKSSLAYSVAYQLNLGHVWRWPITTRATLHDGLYHYDAIARLYDISLEKEKEKEESQKQHTPKKSEDIGQYIRLGPLGTALLPRKKPRVLLIDEIDKSDIDLPNDLLHVLEEGSFDITELLRYGRREKDGNLEPVYVFPSKGDRASARVVNGWVRCQAFPFVVMTSNGEREFPPAFLRRCIRLNMERPNPADIKRIVEEHLGQEAFGQAENLVEMFEKNRQRGDVATDQLLNAIYLKSWGADPGEKKELFEAILRQLNQG